MSDEVRALYWAARVDGAPAPFDTIHLKLFYPAAASGSDHERLSGVVPPDAGRAPYPVVVLMPGVNIGPDSYRWLAERLAAAGNLAVTYTWVGALFANEVGATPGLDADACRPGYTGPRADAASAVPAILAGLREANERTVLAELVDLDRVVLGGHSGGGTVALLGADPAVFPAVRGGFAYAAHTIGTRFLGWDPGAVMPLSPDVPLLLTGGTRDGVMAGSADRYGESAEDREDPIVRTFDHALSGERGDRYLVLFEGANHFAPADPLDRTTARAFLDAQPTLDGARVRELLGPLVLDFVAACARDDAEAAQRLRAFVDAPPPDVALARAR